MEPAGIRLELIPLTVSILFTFYFLIEVFGFEELTLAACGTRRDDKSKRDVKQLMLNFQSEYN
jgi:hypothetical protein